MGMSWSFFTPAEISCKEGVDRVDHDHENYVDNDEELPQRGGRSSKYACGQYCKKDEENPQRKFKHRGIDAKPTSVSWSLWHFRALW